MWWEWGSGTTNKIKVWWGKKEKPPGGAGRITQDAHETHLQQFKARQQEINLLLEEHTEADESHVIATSTVLNLVKRARALFDSSEVAEKRALLNFLLQNSTVDGKKPSYALRSPFETILIWAKRPTGLLG